MPTNGASPTSSMGSARHEEASRHELIAKSKKINWKGHDVLDAEGRVVAIQNAIKTLEERNPDLLKVHSSHVVKYGVFLFALICVYGIDILLFGATAEYVASLITDNWLLVLLAKYGIPLFFLGIEVLISLNIIEARDARRQDEVPNYVW